jgi:hypothetical protein
LYPLAAVLAGCAAPRGDAGVAGRSAAPPQYRVGDRWDYGVADGFREPVVWNEVHEVTELGAQGLHVRVVVLRDGRLLEREELWSQPGLLLQGALLENETRQFDTPLRRFDFPLEPGKRWDERVRNYDVAQKHAGEISQTVVVEQWARVGTRAGTFDALRMRVVTRLDDGEFWRQPTQCSDVLWYAPDVRNVVRAERDAQYVQGTGASAALVRSRHAVVELLAFAAG